MMAVNLITIDLIYDKRHTGNWSFHDQSLPGAFLTKTRVLLFGIILGEFSTKLKTIDLMS